MSSGLIVAVAVVFIVVIAALFPVVAVALVALGTTFLFLVFK